MKLDWAAQAIPGKCMFNLELGTNVANVVMLLKKYEVSDGIIKIDNSDSIRVDILLNEEVIRLRKMEDEKYDWQSDVALLYFKNDKLKSIVTYLNEPHGYRGLICGKIGLGDEIRELEEYFSIEYDNVNEHFSAIDDNGVSGLELYGASCDLSVDPTQKISAMKVFLVE